MGRPLPPEAPAASGLDEAGKAAFLDELWQAQKWGSDWEAEDRRAMIRGEIEQAHHFLSLIRDAG